MFANWCNDHRFLPPAPAEMVQDFCLHLASTLTSLAKLLYPNILSLDLVIIYSVASLAHFWCRYFLGSFLPVCRVATMFV